MAKRLFIRREGTIGIALYVVSAALVAVSFSSAAVADRYGFAAGVTAFGAIALVPILYRYARRARNKIFLSEEALQQYLAQRNERLFVFLREFDSDTSRDP